MNFLYSLLLTLLVLASVVVMLAVLLQAGKGGGLASNFGGAGSSSDSLLGTRQASNILTKTSWTAGGIFLGLSFILSLWSARPAGPPKSILDETTQNPTTQTSTTPASSAAPLPDLLNPPKPTTDTGSAKAAGAKAPTGKAGDAKTPAKVPPVEQ